MSESLRVAGALVGDINRQCDMCIKYGGFFDALAKHTQLVDVYDASLKGFDRYWNALQVFSPSRKRWKEHFFKNVPAFHMRSRRARSYFLAQKGQTDLVLQLGALFDITSDAASIPVVLYTDNTTSITVRQPGSLNRNPFNADELRRWLDLETAVYRRAVHICVRAGIVKRSLMDDYGISPEKISVIGAGVNFSMLPQTATHRRAAEPRLLFIGLDFHRKGGDLVLSAFAWVRKLIPNAQLTLVTQGPIQTGLSLSGVRVLAPVWDRSLLEELYRESDIFILPSRHETWGDVLLEAMSFGLPCIGVWGQAMEDIIVNGETGLLVPPEQAELLAQAIIQLFERPDLCYRMGQAARRLVAEQFTWDRVVDRLFPILLESSKLSTTSLERMSI